jgi:hypothetical protein
VVDEHVAQILGYLRSARIETGLLINFGAPTLHLKKYLMTDPMPDGFEAGGQNLRAPIGARTLPPSL